MSVAAQHEVQMLRAQLHQLQQEQIAKNDAHTREKMKHMEELEQLSDQLSSQIEYNNTLLEQLQALERQQLASQQGVQDRQQALRTAHTEIEHLRSENGSLRAELLSTQRQLRAAQDENVNMRDGIQGSRTEIDQVRRDYNRLRDENALLKEERISLQDKTETLSRQIAQMSSTHQTFQSDAQSRITELQLARDTALQEVAELRRVLADLEREHNVAKQSIGSLQGTLDNHSKGLTSERTRAAQAEARINVLEDALRMAADKEKHISARCQQLERDVWQLKEELRNRTSELLRLKEEAGVVSREREEQLVMLQRQDEELRHMRHEAESMRMSAHASSQEMLQERDTWEKRLTEAQRELQTLADRARKQARDHEEQLRAKDEELAAQRQVYEAKFKREVSALQQQYVSVQNEYSHLHELLQNVQHDKTAQLKTFEQERDALEDKVSFLQSRLDATEQALHERELKLRDDATSAKAQIETLQVQLADRTSKHVMALDLLQEQVHSASAIIAEQTEHYNRMMGELRALHSALQQSVAEQAAQTEAVYDQMRKMMEESRNLRAENDRMRDEVRMLEVAKEEERSRTLMAQESVARMEQDLSNMQHKLSAAEERAASVQQAQASAARAEVVSLRSELQTREALHDDLKAQLEKSNQQRRTLQEDNQQLTRQLADLQQRWTSRVKALEEQLESLKIKAESSSTEKSLAAEERDSVHQALAELQQESAQQISRLQQEVQLLQAKLRSKEEEDSHTSAKNRSQLQQLQESLRKFQAQHAQTQSLLLVVQEQRKHLQTDNAALRAELDQIYRTQQSGAGQAEATLRSQIDDLQRRNRMLEDKCRSLQEYRQSNGAMT